MNITRRSILGGLGSLALGSTINWMDYDIENLSLKEGMTILFQGDSITDAGRNRGAYYSNNSGGMGQGYVRHAVTELLGNHPDKGLNIYNRGISGHKVFQLRDRWEDDCLMLKPDVLSILIGVNDFWHTLDWNYDGTAKVYEEDFVKLVERTKKELPGVKLIIGEPFVLHEGTSIKPDLWKGQFEAYQEASRRVAKQFDAVFIPYQSIFDNSLNDAPTSYWCPDGVHPSMGGNFLMAQAWLKAFQKSMK